MAPMTRKRKASSEANGAAKEPTTSKPAQSRAKTKPVARGKAKEPRGEYDDDEGRSDSKQFFETAKKSKSRRLNVDSAKKDIRTNVNELISFINTEQKRNRPSFNVGAALSRNLATEVKRIMVGRPTDPKQTTVDSIENTTFTAARQALKDAQETVTKYKALASQKSTIQKPIWMLWEQDGKDLNELNQHAMATAARTINSLIIPTAKPSITAPLKQAAVVEKVAWELFEEVRPENMDNTWGKMAQGHFKAFAGILRSMKDS